RPRVHRRHGRVRQPPAHVGGVGAGGSRRARRRMVRLRRRREGTLGSMNQLATLARVFAYLSLLTFGGGMAAYPELKTLSVDVHPWVTPPQLDYLYSVGQMAPGPNMLMIVSLGSLIAGLPGAIIVLFAFLGPTA